MDAFLEAWVQSASFVDVVSEPEISDAEPEIADAEPEIADAEPEIADAQPEIAAEPETGFAVVARTPELICRELVDSLISYGLACNLASESLPAHGRIWLPVSASNAGDLPARLIRSMQRHPLIILALISCVLIRSTDTVEQSVLLYVRIVLLKWYRY